VFAGARQLANSHSKLRLRSGKFGHRRHVAEVTPGRQQPGDATAGSIGLIELYATEEDRIKVGTLGGT